MSNWDVLCMTISPEALAAWLERELGDGVPTDWLAWLMEEAHENPKSWGGPPVIPAFAEAILAALSKAAERNSAPKEDSHET